MKIWAKPVVNLSLRRYNKKFTLLYNVNLMFNSIQHTFLSSVQSKKLSNFWHWLSHVIIIITMKVSLKCDQTFLHVYNKYACIWTIHKVNVQLLRISYWNSKFTYTCPRSRFLLFRLVLVCSFAYGAPSRFRYDATGSTNDLLLDCSEAFCVHFGVLVSWLSNGESRMQSVTHRIVGGASASSLYDAVQLCRGISELGINSGRPRGQMNGQRVIMSSPDRKRTPGCETLDKIWRSDCKTRSSRMLCN